MHLTPFVAEAAGQISSWPRSADEVFAWSSRVDTRVSPDVIIGWSMPADVEAFVLMDDGMMIAYGECWIDHDEQEVEFAHLIVAPGERGRGVGRQLVALLTDRAERHYPLVTMRVHPDNEIARRCYAAAGFERATPDEECRWNVGQPVAFVWMLRRVS